MSVSSIHLDCQSMESGGSASQQTATRAYTVITTDSTDTELSFSYPLTAGTETIPAPDTPHPSDDEYISQMPMVRREGPTVWKITVPYLTVDPNNSTMPLSPLSAPADLSFEDEDRSVPYDRDRLGNAIVNANDEPFNPPLQRTVSDAVFVIERNQAAFALSDKIFFQDSVNSVAYGAVLAGMGKLGHIPARLVNGKVPYWRVSYRITIRSLPAAVLPGGDVAYTWHRAILDKGLKYKDGGGKLQVVADGVPVLLAADGTKTTPAAPHWLYFCENLPEDWTPLGLPPPPV